MRGGSWQKRDGVGERGWKRRFDDPIRLPRGGQPVTLEDAGTYITRLPEAEHEGSGMASRHGSLDPGRDVRRPDDVRAHRQAEEGSMTRAGFTNSGFCRLFHRGTNRPRLA